MSFSSVNNNNNKKPKRAQKYGKEITPYAVVEVFQYMILIKTKDMYPEKYRAIKTLLLGEKGDLDKRRSCSNDTVSSWWERCKEHLHEVYIVQKGGCPEQGIPYPQPTRLQREKNGMVDNATADRNNPRTWEAWEEIFLPYINEKVDQIVDDLCEDVERMQKMCEGLKIQAQQSDGTTRSEDDIEANNNAIRKNTRKASIVSIDWVTDEKISPKVRRTMSTDPNISSEYDVPYPERFDTADQASQLAMDLMKEDLIDEDPGLNRLRLALALSKENVNHSGQREEYWSKQRRLHEMCTNYIKKAIEIGKKKLGVPNDEETVSTRLMDIWERYENDEDEDDENEADNTPAGNEEVDKQI